MRAHLRQFGFALGVCAIALTGCAKTESPGADSTAVSPPVVEAPLPPAVSLSDIAGTWNIRSTPETGDKTPTNLVLTATNTTEGWTFKFPNRDAVPVRVTVSGDSVLTDAGPYQSVRRRNVQVSTKGVMWLRGDTLVGKTVARYATTGPDSVLTLTTVGTRSR